MPDNELDSSVVDPAEELDVDPASSGTPAAEPEEAEAEKSDDAVDEKAVLTKRLKDAQRKITELGQQRAELTGKLSIFEQQAKGSAEAEKDLLDEVSDDELSRDPKSVLKRVRDDIAQKFVALIQERDKYWQGQLQAINPEVSSLKDTIEELKQDPDYATLPDQALFVIAKKMRAQGGDPTPLRRAPVAAGGGRVRVDADGDVRKSDLFRRVYGDMFDKKGAK